MRIATLKGKDWTKALQNFFFQYRTTPHTVSGLPQAQLLISRRLNDKLLRVSILSEAYWQQLLWERDARWKRRQREYADSKRQHNTVIM